MGSVAVKALDAEELEVMREAMTPDTRLCPRCGTPTDDGEPLAVHLASALWRCVARGLVSVRRCGDRFDLHFDATPAGRLILHAMASEDAS